MLKLPSRLAQSWNERLRGGQETEPTLRGETLRGLGLLVETGEEEGVYLAEFDMDKLRAYRKHGTWGNAYRRPGSYSILTSSEVEEPFIRADARR